MCFIIILQQVSFYKNYNFYLDRKIVKIAINKQLLSVDRGGAGQDQLTIETYQKECYLLDIYQLQRNWMSDVQLYENHRKLYSAFYDKIIKKHSNRAQLARKFTNFISKVALPENQSDQMHLRTITPRKSNKLQITNQFQSLRMTNSTSKNTLQANRSRISRRSDSSKQKSEFQGKFFGVDWVYSSLNPERVYVFALLASFILNDNSVGFYILMDRIDEQMTKNSQAVPPILLVSISKYWQKIVEIVTKKKSYLWEKYLKQPVDRMPLQFNKLISKLSTGKQLEDTGYNKEVVGKLSKEGRTNIASFIINYRQIEKVQRQGDFKKQIVIGYLKHSNTYVLASKMPQYSQAELKNRKAKTLIQTNIQELLLQYKADEQDMNLLEDSKLPKQKDKFVKEFFGRKLALLKSL